MVTLRRCKPRDTRRIVDLMRVAMPMDAVTTDWFTDNILLDQHFDPDGLIIAEVEAQVVGFAVAVTAVGQESVGMPVPDGGGWITLFAVHPDHRGRGIGRTLIRAAVRHLADRGARFVQLAGYPPAYLVPGVDAEAYPEALALLESEGFTTRSSPVAMDLSLATHRAPEAVLALRGRREAEGYRFSAATLEDLPEVIKHAATDLAPDWGEVVRQSVRQHRRPERVLLIRAPDGTVVGFATYGAYGGMIERFGPFGVRDDQRGAGLGRILLYETLAAMRAEGAHVAWFLWTGEESPAGQLYLATGFTVTRRFQVLQRDLDQRSTPPNAQLPTAAHQE
ncbi:GNAT family N-acetyltransferase [Propionibacteriaceae bacterium Y1685]